MTSTQDRLDQMEAAANETVLERAREIRCIINALLCRRHVILVGSWGIAKSFLCRTMMGLVGPQVPGDYFEYALDPYVTPDDLFGPRSFRALEAEDRHVRNTAGRLPVARLAFLGEIDKASGGMRKALLTIMNERLFENGDADPHVPLATLVADTNTTLEHDPLLWDRFLFRVETQPLRSPRSFDAMLRAAAGRYALLGATSQPLVEPLITWDALARAQEEVAHVDIGDDVYAAMGRLWEQLAADRVVLSDRRYAEALSAIQAEAYRQRRKEAEVADMAPLVHIAWHRPDQQRIVQRRVFALANPLDALAMELADEVEMLATEVTEVVGLPATPARGRAASQLHTKLKAASARLADLRKQADGAGRRLETYKPLRRLLMDLNKALIALPEIQRPV